MLLALGDDVTKKVLAYYLAFKRIKNFACVEFRPQLGVLRMFLSSTPARSSWRKVSLVMFATSGTSAPATSN